MQFELKEAASPLPSYRNPVNQAKLSSEQVQATFVLHWEYPKL